jgi:hypothetical protein
LSLCRIFPHDFILSPTPGLDARTHVNCAIEVDSSTDWYVLRFLAYKNFWEDQVGCYSGSLAEKNDINLICHNNAQGKNLYELSDELNISFDELKKHNLKYVYYGGVNIKDTPFVDYVEVGLDFAKVTTPLRVQLYIRSKAKINIGYQSSIYELICRYSPIVCTEMDGGPRENYFDNITYLK